MLGIFRKPKVEGDIAAFGLESWWLDTFSKEDREWMASTYSPMGAGENPLIEGDGIPSTRRDAFSYLCNVAPWFNKDGRQHCAIAFIDKAMDFYDESIDVLDRHFALSNQCRVVYRWRDVLPGALDRVVQICELSISFHSEAAVECQDKFGLMPSHACFQQLRIIEEKRGNYERAIELCEMAKTGGWAGGWDADIARIQKKQRALAKKTKT